ncbi:MAG: DEAD/DEAH box helicase, partial [candidate division KSB1 bacterium]|nr:DEAD/DEAH box helicase [candidate division KSB1 bacterium]
MDVTEIKNIILQSTEIQVALDAIDHEQNTFIKGLHGSLKSIFLALLFERKKVPICLVTGDEEQGEALREDLELLLGSAQVSYLPRISEIAQRDIVIDSIRKGQLLNSLERLVEGRTQVILVAAKNISLRYPAPQWIQQLRVVLATGQSYDFDRLKTRLAGLGFNREMLVENGGEMSVRGGIVDVFPFSSEYPYRIEFFGDTIESIRIFDPVTQRSIERVAQVIIYPQYPEQSDANTPEWGRSLFDYLKDGTILFLDEPALIQKEVDEFVRFAPTAEANDNFAPQRWLDWAELSPHFSHFRTIFHNPMLDRSQHPIHDIGSQAQESLRGNFGLLKKKIESFCSMPSKSADQKWRLYFCCDNRDQVDRFEELLTDAKVDCQSIAIRDWGLNQGFVFPAAGLVLFTDNQFYGRQIRWRRRKRTGRGLTPQQLHALKIGDYVVHEDHGIGQYRGFKKITVRGSERECLSIVYQDNDFLYVPLERMDRVQKYAAKEGVVPMLSKLGSKDWDRLKKKTKKYVKEMARELIRLYALRKAQKGFAFSRDTLWQKELEASFEYEDTPDQRRVTEEVKQDMESESPMDRLVCGDVGFGKTEIAIRAAFKAVNDNKQVAVLVPTTILALQHYNLFRERLKNYPIKIELLSRFRSAAEQKLVVQWLKEGRVDIVIGTHRLLSNDVQFGKLGLLVIDEEHRFGVKNKERLKQKYVNVDVLSMSATPIPRTLNMGLLGIRDLSLIATPPRERLPIYTEVAP